MSDISQLQKSLNFILVICKDKKKFKKFEKVNKLRNKYVIDIKKMMEDENLTSNNISNSSVFKLNLLKKFNLAKEKKKHIYYIPNLVEQNSIQKLFNIKDIMSDTHNFTLLYFYDDFTKDEQPLEILEKISEFDYTQILEDY